MKKRAPWAFVVAAALAAGVWALSRPITGKIEPWDAEWPYYFIALAIAGAVSGAVIPAHFGGSLPWRAIWAGRIWVVFLELGPLFVLGLVFLAGYSVIFLATAAVVASFRARPPQPAQEEGASPK